MKIAIFDVEPASQYLLHQRFEHNPNFVCEAFSSPLTARELEQIKDVEIVSVFVSSHLDEAILSKLPKLKMISLRSTGFDNVDLAYTKKNNITVCNVPSYGENTVAEYTFMLLLALVRKLPASIEQIEQGRINHSTLTGIDLRNKTLGVVGTGRIGKHVITIARGFGMSVLGFDPLPDNELVNIDGFTYTNFEQLLKSSDIITIHVPSTKQNYHLFNEQVFVQLKKGVYLINTSRGELIDTKILVEALSSGQVGGAALDVIEQENLLTTDDEISLLASNEPKGALSAIAEQAVLEKMDNVILTPHNAFNTTEAIERIWTVALENIEKYYAGQPQNIVGEK